MDKYDRQYQKYQQEYENSLAELDRKKNLISSKEYWKEFKVITDEYTKLIDDLWASKEASENLLAVKEGNNLNASRPERDYESVLGQMKAEKMRQLIKDLSEISTLEREMPSDIKDPFSQDRKDPISVFEVWWQNELQKLPSIDEVDDFLRRISIDSHGYIVFDYDSKVPKLPSSNVLSEYRMNNFSRYKDDFFLAKPNDKNKKKQSTKFKNTAPLLFKKDPERLLELEKQRRKSTKNLSIVNRLCSIVDGYELPDELSCVLYEHIEKVCVPKGLIHEDEYHHMLTQFLRFTSSDDSRIQEVKRAIQRGWRSLYYDEIK